MNMTIDIRTNEYDPKGLKGEIETDFANVNSLSLAQLRVVQRYLRSARIFTKEEQLVLRSIIEHEKLTSTSTVYSMYTWVVDELESRGYIRKIVFSDDYYYVIVDEVKEMFS